MWRRFPEPARAHEVLMVITGAEISVRHHPAGTRRMHEATASCIDSHVIDVAAVDTEKNQVARR